MKILIIDDEIHVAAMLAEAVSRQGHQATVASDGEEGLVLISQNRPDAVFLDVVLREMNGIDVLRRIRRTDPTLPVILITGHADPDQLAEAQRLGVTDILEKPFLLNQLSSALAFLKA